MWKVAAHVYEVKWSWTVKVMYTLQMKCPRNGYEKIGEKI